MKKKFIVNIIFLIILNILIKPFWFFGIEVSVQNRLGNEAYGLYASILSFTIIFNFLLDLGITNFNNREIARHRQLIHKYFSNIIVIKLIFAGGYTILCFVIGYLVGYTLTALKLLLILIFNQILSSLILYLRSNINAMLLFVTDSILSILDKFLMIIFLSVLLWTKLITSNFTIEWFVLSQSLAYVITAIVTMLLVIKHGAYFQLKFDFRYIYLIVKKSLPFTILVFLMGLYNRMEPILLERLLQNGDYQAGLYAQGYRIFEVLSNFALLFAVLLLPLFSKMLKENEKVDALVNTASSLLLVPAVIISVSSSFFATNIIETLYHESEGGSIFKIIILGFPGLCLTYIFGTLLTANGSFKQLNSMAALAVIFNFFFNLFIIPIFLAKGAAFSSFLTQSLTGLAQCWLAIKILRIETQNSIIKRIVIWLALLITLNYFIQLLPLHWVLNYAVAIGSGIVSALTMKLIKIHELIAFFPLKPKPSEP